MTSDQESSYIAERLEELFEKIRRPKDGRRYSYRQVEQKIKELRKESPHYKPVTASYIWKILSGKTKYPSFAALESLAAFFQVDVTYFSQNNTKLEDAEKIILTRQLAQGKVIDIANQVSLMDESEQQMVLEIMETIFKIRHQTTKDEVDDV